MLILVIIGENQTTEFSHLSEEKQKVGIVNIMMSIRTKDLHKLVSRVC